MRSNIDALAIAHASCPRCGAEPGAYCTTRNGRSTSYPHAKRAEGVRTGWAIGFDQGGQECIDLIERTVEVKLRHTADGEGRGDLPAALQVALAKARRFFSVKS